MKIYTDECEFVIDKNMARGANIESNLVSRIYFMVGSSINVMLIAGLDRLKVTTLLLYVDVGASELFLSYCNIRHSKKY